MAAPLNAEVPDNVGKKRLRSTSESSLSHRAPKKNRQDDVLRAMGEEPVTERHILEVRGC
jgi:hypothetical protein